MKHILTSFFISLIGVLGYTQLTQAATLDVANSTSFSGTGHRIVMITNNDIDYAVVAADDVMVYQLSDDAAPSLVGSYVTTGTAYDVAVSSDLQYLYIADGSTTTTTSCIAVCIPVTTVKGHVLVLSMANPTAPALVADYSQNLGNFQALELVGTTLYAADVTTGLHVINVANPAAPTQVAVLSDYLAGNDLTSDGTYLFMLIPLYGITGIFDITTPTTPTYVGTVVVYTNASQLLAENNVLYVSDGDNGLSAYDYAVSITLPVLLGTYNTPGTTQGFTLHNGLGYIADNTGGVVAINASTPANMTAIATSTAVELESAHDVVYAGKYAYVLTDMILYQVALNFDFSVKGSKDGKVGNVTIYDGDNVWLTVAAYSKEVGAQAFLGDVNKDGLAEVVTAPVGKMKNPKMQIYDPILGTLLSSKKLSTDDTKRQFVLGVGDYYKPESQAEIVASELSSGDLKLSAYFVKTDNSIKQKATYSEADAMDQFITEGYKIKIKSDKSYPIILQAKESTDVKEKFQLKKNSDGSFMFLKKA